MDCEKFDQQMLDALYGELDEPSLASFERHVESCSRCKPIYAGLRATRDVGVLPLVEPSDDLEEKILAAAGAAERRTPWTRKVLRGLAWAGSHAMRPQLAMAALFFLVIGSSLLLLRARPNSQYAVPVRVTERGAPADDGEAQARSAEQPIAAATAAAAPSAADAVEGANEAEQAKDGKAYGEGDKDGRAALADARSTRNASGCSAAVKKYDDVGARFAGTAIAAEAMWEAASCYESMGQADKARQLWLALRSNNNYRGRAEEKLGTADNNNLANNAQSIAAKPQAPPSAAPTAEATALALEAPPAAPAGGVHNRAAAPKAKAPAGGGPGSKAAPSPVRAPAKNDNVAF